MGEPYLTMAEIEKRYPNEWVLIDRPRIDKHNDVIGGAVVVHAADREAFDRELYTHPLADSAILYTGRLPELPFDALWFKYEV